MRNCENCHWGDAGALSPCFDDPCCFDNEDHPNWQPMTNGDKVRLMTDEDPRELWSVQSFDSKYFPKCKDAEDGCTYWNHPCDCCPETFYNWLKAEAEE